MSRGLLVVDLIDSRMPEEVACRLVRSDLNRYQSFTMVVLKTGEPPMLIEWAGGTLRLRASCEGALPLVSSSFDTATVIAARRRLFADCSTVSTIDADLLRRFHASHEPARGPLSPCMHRADAATVSFSWIRVTEDHLEFFYLPHAPCAKPGDDGLLDRHPAAARVGLRLPLFPQ